MSTMTAPAAPAPAIDREALGRASVENANRRAGGCARPVRLTGHTAFVNTITGEVDRVYASADELDGYTYARCGNRRASVCPSCSREYKGDAWHLLLCGMAGGKGIPESVSDHPCTFATLTAPPFGPVHGVRDKGPCRARRDKPVCPHGRPAWCSKRHADDDPQVGQPLCFECYDYTAHVVWQWHAPELWRRFSIALQRELAKQCELAVAKFRKHCKIAYSKVAEFQARGAIHYHVPIRLDGPEGPDGPPPDLPLTTAHLEAAVKVAAAHVRLDSAPVDGIVYRLRWGSQMDCRTITDNADPDRRSATRIHPRQIAAYLAKYLTKATEDFGFSSKVFSAKHAAKLGASPHVIRLIETAEHVHAVGGKDYERLSANYESLGYRGHPMTKSHKYSVTFGQIRRARRIHRARPAGLDPDADIRHLVDADLDEDLPDGFERVGAWEFAGLGYLGLYTAAEAVESAIRARVREQTRTAAHQRLTSLGVLPDNQLTLVDVAAVNGGRRPSRRDAQRR
jgi:hypothetical protein